MVPLGVEGAIKSIRSGEFTVEDTIAKVESRGKTVEVTLTAEEQNDRSRVRSLTD